jgi:hypothetical protein
MKEHKKRYVMPKLAGNVAEALEDRNLSMSDFMRRPISSGGERPPSEGLSPDLSVQLRGWIFRSFQEIHRVMSGLDKDEPPDGCQSLSAQTTDAS